jgi:adenylate kinase
MRVVFLGPPGAGKGTQAKKLQADLGVPHVSTGDMLRDAASRGTELGKLAAPLMRSGQLVPDELVVGIALERLKQPDAANGFILDGFPRTIPQAESLDAALGKAGKKLDAVVSFDVPEEVLIERISGRRSCPKCGTVYHVAETPPRRSGFCDKCGSELVQREDDKPEKIRQRLAVYADQTTPLKAYYARRGLLRNLDGIGPPEQVYRELKKALGKI